MRKRTKVQAGSGDVFVDLGMKDAVERKLRVTLARQIAQRIEERRLADTEAAIALGIDPEVYSDLRNYKLGRLSSERLRFFLSLL